MTIRFVASLPTTALAALAIFSMLRIRRGSPGRVQTMPQADFVASSCMGMVSASAFASCLST